MTFTMEIEYFEEHFLFKVKRFLSDIHGERKPSCAWIAKKYSTDKTYRLGKAGIDGVLENILKFNTKWRNEIFFSLRSWYPKTISSKKESTKGKPKRKWFPKPIRCFCIDVDCGTESNEVHYHRIEECRVICGQRGIPFTHTVISRNGFHLYWTVSEGVEEGLWIEIQNQLIGIFNSDPSVNLATQDMRLPYTYHWKDCKAGKLVRVVFEEVEPYKLDPFMHAIGMRTRAEETAYALGATDGDSDPISFTPPSIFSNYNKADPLPLQIAPPKPRTEDASHTDRYLEIAEVLEGVLTDPFELNRYVRTKPGKHKAILCPFHPDKRPSARIYETKHGTYLYKCYGCKYRGDLIELVKKVEKLDGKKLISRILTLVGREDLIIPERDLGPIDDNLNLLKTLSKGKVEGIRIDRPLLDYLIKFNQLSKKKIRNNDLKFAASLAEVQRNAGEKHLQRSTCKLYFLVFMELIRRLPLDEIPKECLEENRRYNESKGNKNLTSWWYIPVYTADILKMAMEKRALLRTAKINLANISKSKLEASFDPALVGPVFVGESTFTADKAAKEEKLAARRKANAELFDALIAQAQDEKKKTA